MTDSKVKKISELRKAIELGEKSGYVNNFDPKEYLETLKKEYLKLNK